MLNELCSSSNMLYVCNYRINVGRKTNRFVLSNHPIMWTFNIRFHVRLLLCTIHTLSIRCYIKNQNDVHKGETIQKGNGIPNKNRSEKRAEHKKVPKKSAYQNNVTYIVAKFALSFSRNLTSLLFSWAILLFNL